MKAAIVLQAGKAGLWRQFTLPWIERGCHGLRDSGMVLYVYCIRTEGSHGNLIGRQKSFHFEFRRGPSMNLNADFTKRAVVHAATLDWKACRRSTGRTSYSFRVDKRCRFHPTSPRTT